MTSGAIIMTRLVKMGFHSHEYEGESTFAGVERERT
jgi:hypothetical protein